jgi:hypothetical protein
MNRRNHSPIFAMRGDRRIRSFSAAFPVILICLAIGSKLGSAF